VTKLLDELLSSNFNGGLNASHGTEVPLSHGGLKNPGVTKRIVGQTDIPPDM
jgi:hypothetical protein